MNALIYADEYQRLEQRLDQLQGGSTKHGCNEHQLTADHTFDNEWHQVVRRLMQLDDLIAFDGDLAS